MTIVAATEPGPEGPTGSMVAGDLRRAGVVGGLGLDGEAPSVAVTDAAYAALDRGEVDIARALAQSSLEGTSETTDPQARARVLTCLAHCDRILCRPKRASDAARTAAQLFEQAGDIPGEVGALIVFSHVTVLIGRTEEALEAALLAVELSDTGVPQVQTMLAYNCLGLAYCWSGDHERAHDVLEHAVSVGRICVPEVSPYQPRLNQVWVESSRLVRERYHTGRMPSLERLERLMGDCRRLEAAGQGVSPVPGIRHLGETIVYATACLREVWSGDLAAADRAFQSAVGALSPGRSSWLLGFLHWCAAELAWARGDWAVAEQRLVDMRETAIAVEHVRLACMAELLLAEIFERQGKHDEAGRAYRSLRRRESQAMADGVGSRKALVASQVRARRSERRLQQALLASRQFERWSFEDPLTGIANRREVERRLRERLVRSSLQQPALSVAMVDVDGFKLINDRYTHSAGDQVLKTVAALLTAHVRPQDLPARWAGDEFVILFDGVSGDNARSVCARIHAAVAGYDWPSVALGLSVSLSIGVSEAVAGDTIESVMQRSDEAMYREKRVDRGHAGR